jgi:hypothetical protein
MYDFGHNGTTMPKNERAFDEVPLSGFNLNSKDVESLEMV